MDIRSFFNKGSKPKPKPEKINKKKRYIISDSEDDDELLIVKVTDNESKKRKTDSPRESKPSGSNVAPTLFFGSSTVKKVEKPKTEPKTDPKPSIERKGSEDVFGAMGSDEEEELFNDVSFMETLDQLSNNKKENIAPSPAEKLAQKKKGLNWKEKVGISPGNKDKASNKRPRESSVSNGNKEVLDVTPVSKAQIKIPKTEKMTPRLEKTSSDSTTDDTPKSKSGYKAYLTREGPKNLGSKEVPVGAPNCLEGLVFVVTGVLDSIERDQAVTLIQRYGGRTTTAVSKKTNYLVAGEGSGVSKLEKAEKLKTPKLDEDGLFQLIRTLSGKKSKYEIDAEKAVKNSEKTKMPKKEEREEIKAEKKREETKEIVKTEMNEAGPSHLKTEQTGKEPAKKVVCSEGGSQLWVEKYRPKRVKDIIGQQGDRSNVKKLLNWLENWSKWHMSGNKPPFNKDIGSHFKAALLSGSPGVGKTTAATICSKDSGYTYVELNASDVRSKKSLQESVSSLLNNHTVNGLLARGASDDKHVLIMDEVDGMAGNEDRGGVAELIALIKKSSIPIICICNDRYHQKIKSLANYCFDLRFIKPRMETVKAAMMTIAFREGLKIPPPAMQKIVESANCDIRQILNHLCMWTAKSKSMTFDQAIGESDKARKDMKVGIFDVARLFFTLGEETRRFTYLDYQELFFQDYSFCPMFVQENYPSSVPARAKGNNIETLRCLSRAADSLCEGDIVNTAIKMENWSLLPTQAHFSAIMPGYYMRGGLRGRVEFPMMLGQMSKKNRCDSMLQELLNHMILTVNTDKRQLGMEYLPILKKKLSAPLIKKESDGICDVIDMMNNYNLLRDDWDTVMELSTFPPSQNPSTQINTKTKTAFTRKFNQQAHATPYAIATGPAKKRKAAGAGDEELSEEEGEGKSLDAMIKAAKKKPAPKKRAPPKPKSEPKKRAQKKK